MFNVKMQKIMNRHIIHITTCCLLALSLGSCGIYTQFDAPRYDLEDAYPHESGSDSTSMGDIRWQDFFPDTKLQALIEKALQHNADLQTAFLNVEAAQATLKNAKLAYLPSLDFSAGAGYSEETWSTQLPVSTEWTIDLFGNLRNAKRGQQAALLQTEAYAQAVRSELIVTVATAYYSLLSLDAQHAIYRQTAQSWKENVETTRHLVESGRYNAASLAQAEANYCNVLNSLIDIRQEISRMENELCALIGDTAHPIDRDSLDNWQAPALVDTGIPARVLYNRPDVRQAEQALAQAFYATNAARSAFYPSLTITGSYDFRHSIYEAVGSLLQPLFQRGTLRANLKVAKAGQAQAEIAFRQTLIDAGMEVNNALIAIKSTREKSENYTRQIQYLEEAVKYTSLLMKNGSTTYLEILTAQQTLLEAQINEVANRQSEISEFLSLYQALGGGSL